ncbi:ribbon-helix-helix domain-containing protein [Hathewaya histolytica]|uniref:CopG-family transcriptional regulator n=1 Tax=Hathewaya histolytica TaxID=1498 RepID=A0A4U9R0N3_HATHI|nr:ribbon-helix-helix domain-containing protein [Hathewaya histolytica]VTQ83771.1 CopG-family transcriptional regulator [Hathewaya histolytica]
MSRKRLVISLSETLNNELNEVIKKNNIKKSKFIREAIILYIEETKKLKLQEQMKKGYEEMAEVNLQYCELGFENYNEELNEYETGLLESDFPYDNDSETRRYILC